MLKLVKKESTIKTNTAEILTFIIPGYYREHDIELQLEFVLVEENNNWHLHSLFVVIGSERYLTSTENLHNLLWGDKFYSIKDVQKILEINWTSTHMECPKFNDGI